jgi:hypothetical protein
MEFPVTVNTQEAFDALIKGRLERARQQWESEGGIAEARDAAREASSRAEAAEARARQKLAVRDARSILKDMGVTERSRQERILRLADLGGVTFDDEGEPNEKDLRRSLKAVHADLPEVFGEDVSVLERAADASQGSVDTGSNPWSTPISSEEQIEAMSSEQINSNWDRISAFLRGQR